MKTYKVTITETLQLTVDIWAKSREEAKIKAQENWANSEYILDADNFAGVSFEAKQEQEIER